MWYNDGMTWKYVVWRASPLLLIILLVSYFSGDGWHAFPSALVAWGTILLAFATFSLVRHSKEQEDHRRQEEQAKEKRDRDEHLLDEIIGWATDVANCRIERDIKEIEELRRMFEAEALRSVYIMNIVEPFTLRLKEAVLNLNGALLEHIELMSKYEEYKKSDDKDKRSEQVEKIRSHNSEISTIFMQVIEEATKIKTRNIGKEEENMPKEGEATGGNEPTLKDIEEHLARIEGHVIQIKKNAKAQGVGGFGFTGMAAGMALVATGVQTTGGLALFGVGLILTLYSFYFM